MTFFQEIKSRLSLPTPTFFKKVAAFGNWMMGVAALILMPIVPESLDIQIPVVLNIVIPQIVTKVAGYVFVAGLFISRTAKLAVTDPTQIEESK